MPIYLEDKTLVEAPPYLYNDGSHKDINYDAIPRYNLFRNNI